VFSTPRREDVVKEVERITGIGADVAFECAGAKPTLQQALELVRMGGRVMLIALAWDQVACLPVDWVGREVEMKTCYEYFNSEWVISMGLMEAKKIKYEPMITKIIPLAQIRSGLQRTPEAGHGPDSGCGGMQVTS